MSSWYITSGIVLSVQGEVLEEEYEPRESTFEMPKSTWKPSSQQYVPPRSNFQLPKSDYQLPKNSYTAPKSQVPAGLGVGSEYAVPLQRLREMGYFNNERSLALLRKYSGDIQKVVNEIFEESDNDWAARRH